MSINSKDYKICFSSCLLGSSWPPWSSPEEYRGETVEHFCVPDSTLHSVLLS